MKSKGNPMNTKHQPATPLPWTTGQMPARWPERDQMYAAHAANAYPKLVEALRQMCDYADSSVSPVAFRAEKFARALLRELGENQS